MASKDTNYPRIRVSPEAKAILDSNPESASKQIDELLGIGAKETTSQKVYLKPESHLLDHAIILALFHISRIDDGEKKESEIWDTLLDGGTEQKVREDVIGYFSNQANSVTGKYTTWAEIYPDFFVNWNAKTPYAVAIHNRLKSLENMGVTIHYNDGKKARWKINPDFMTGTGYDQLRSYTTQCMAVVPSTLNTVEKLDVKTYEPVADSEEVLLVAKKLFDNNKFDIKSLLEAMMIEAKAEVTRVVNQVNDVEGAKKTDLDTSRVELILKDLEKYGIYTEIDEFTEIRHGTSAKEGDIVATNKDGASISMKVTVGDKVIVEATSKQDNNEGYKLWFGGNN